MNTKKTKVTRKGSGRTKGSFSFVPLTMADILAKIADQQTPIPVSRKWAETLGFKVIATPANVLYDSIEGTTPNTAIPVTVTTPE